MNILKRELKNGMKPFLLWALGLFVLVYAGMIKFTGISSGADVTKIIEQFPRVVLAVLGIVGINITTIDGYYAIIVYFAMLCASIYAVSLGSNAVNREAMDRTYEFLFTKPRSRAYIIQVKMLAAFIYLTAFCILNYFFSLSAVSVLNSGVRMDRPILLFTISIWLVGLLFETMAAFLAAVSARTDRGILYGNTSFLILFIISILYDMGTPFLKPLAPFKYFAPWDILDGKLDPFYAVMCLLLSLCFFLTAIREFEKKDLNI